MRSPTRRNKSNPVKTSRAEREYAGALKKVAEQVGAVINGFPAGDPESAGPISNILSRYADAIDPWARRIAARMLADVDLSDRKAWLGASEEISRILGQEIRHAPTGAAMQDLLEEQVVLIKSIPRDAADRVHRLTLEGLEDSTRASTVAKEIQRSTEVSKSKATLIARTEVARSASVLTQVRAESAGSTHYRWHTAGDSDVRHSHKALNGKIFAWTDPPLINEGSDDSPKWMRHHPGQVWNCRCWAEPIFPDD
ncbi:phage minor head protein [Uliginosibacterium sp. sgz301328]|uniref:phage head morphogenesis protein n=1 Tax=Uliginosibacterium sp. sgz301328 TaxID=3243764 RepID=UPI00359E54A0